MGTAHLLAPRLAVALHCSKHPCVAWCCPCDARQCSGVAVVVLLYRIPLGVMPLWSFVLLDGPQHGRLSFPGAQHAKTEGLNNWIAFSYSFSSMGLCVVGTGGRTGEMNLLPLARVGEPPPPTTLSKEREREREREIIP